MKLYRVLQLSERGGRLEVERGYRVNVRHVRYLRWEGTDCALVQCFNVYGRSVI